MSGEAAIVTSGSFFPAGPDRGEAAQFSPQTTGKKPSAPRTQGTYLLQIVEMLTVALSITTEKSYNKLLFPLHGFGSFELGSYAKNPQVKKKKS